MADRIVFGQADPRAYVPPDLDCWRCGHGPQQHRMIGGEPLCIGGNATCPCTKYQAPPRNKEGNP